MKQILTKLAKHSVTVENDVLIVKINKSWYGYIGYNFGSPKITVYLPKAELLPQISFPLREAREIKTSGAVSLLHAFINAVIMALGRQNGSRKFFFLFWLEYDKIEKYFDCTASLNKLKRYALETGRGSVYECGDISLLRMA